MSTLEQIVIAHHKQAGTETRRQLRSSGRALGSFAFIILLKKHGNRYTTRVEKRLRKLEGGR